MPVLFWIHGGANAIGHAGQYNPASLAVKHNLVVVSINYRLGPLGWFANSKLRDTALNYADTSANFGTLDMIEALKWVQQNIAAFGGDPNKVTVFGESAGGHNTASLLVSPLAKGLFHRAMIISGLFVSYPLDAAENNPAPQHFGNRVSSSIVINDILGQAKYKALSVQEALMELQNIPVRTLYESYLKQDRGDNKLSDIDAYTIIEDGIVIPFEGIETAIKEGNYNKLPVITGTNRDEIKAFNMTDASLTSSLFNMIFWVKDSDTYKANAEYRDRIWRLQSVDTIAQALSAHPNQAVYTYRFDWDEQGSLFFNDLSELIGAMHTLSIPFWMGNFDYNDNDPTGGKFFNKNNRSGREPLSDSMMSYFAQFAHTGDPAKGLNGKQAHWLPWANAKANKKLMFFDTTQDGGVRMADKPESIQRLAKDLAADKRFENEAQKCQSLQASRLMFNNVVENLITQSGIKCELN